MKITFLGGGKEIGASSAIVKIGTARILIDCGIRMSGEHGAHKSRRSAAGGRVG